VWSVKLSATVVDAGVVLVMMLLASVKAGVVLVKILSKCGVLVLAGAVSVFVPLRIKTYNNDPPIDMPNRRLIPSSRPSILNNIQLAPSPKSHVCFPSRVTFALYSR